MSGCEELLNYEKPVIGILTDLYEKSVAESCEKQIEKCLVSKTVFTLKDLGLVDEGEDDALQAVFIKDCDENAIGDNLKQVFENGFDEAYTLYFLVESVEKRVKIKKVLDKQLRVAGLKKSKGSFYYVKVPTQSEYHFDVKVSTCLFRTEYMHKDEKGKNTERKGIVYTARLSDLIKMYNAVGDELFTKNLRYRIDDKLGVESSIQKTLEDEPCNFWFYNNGIAMLVDKDVFKEAKETTISFDYSDTKSVQIINGAQTITTSAEYYYESDSKDKIEQAQVLLRVIFSDSSEDTFSESVSLSLNRQKPIRNYDMKYFSDEIRIINSLYKENEGKLPYFYIVRSGEEADSEKFCDLMTFAKIYAIYFLQHPGTAKSRKSSLLSEKNWEDFKKPDDEDDETYFEKRLKSFLGVRKLYGQLDDIFKEKLEELSDKDDPEPQKSVYSFAREFFCAYIAFVANGEDENERDFSTCLLNARNADEKKLLVVVKEMTSCMVDFFEKKNPNNKHGISYNEFKLDSNYEEFRNEMKENKKLTDEIRRMFYKTE